MSGNETPKRDTDPNYITSMEHFEGFDHPEIFAKVQKILPSALTQAALSWGRVAAEVTALFPDVGRQVQDAMNGGSWDGAAADAAAAATSRFAAAGSELTQVISAVAQRIGDVAGAGEAVKVKVPPPVELISIDTVLRLLQGENIFDFQQREEEAWREAIRVMNTTYAPTYGPAGEGVPSFSPPPQVTTIDPGEQSDVSLPPVPEVGPDTGGGIEIPHDDVAVAPPAPAEPAEPAPPPPAPPAPAVSEVHEGPVVHSGQPGVSPDAAPIPIGQGGVIMPTSPSAASGPTAAPDVLGRGATIHPAASTGAGGGVFAGARPARESDRAHRLPDYLVNRRNTDELIGELPPSGPGLIDGSDDEQVDT